ncbi:Atp-binding protein [Globisporangium polare]
MTCPSPSIPELKFSNKRAASEFTQMTFLLRRSMTTYWRTPAYNLTRLFVFIAIALVYGVIFAGANYTTYQGINSGVGMVFLSTVFCGLVSFFSVLPVAFAERASFYRERSSQTYNVLWYFLGTSVAEIPYVFFSAALYTAVFFPLVGFTGFQTAIAYWLNTSLLVLMQTYTGQLLAFALPSEELALLLGVLLNSIFFLFMGFNPPASAIPKGFKWLYHVIPKRYSFSILAALVFTDCPESEVGTSNSDLLGCQALIGAPPTTHYANVKEHVEDIFGAKHDEMSSNMAVVLLSIVVIRVLGLLALRFISRQERLLAVIGPYQLCTEAPC